MTTNTSTRRTALAYLALTAVGGAGCSRYGESATPDTPAEPEVTAKKGGTASSSDSSGTAPPTSALASTADIPVGGGVILTKEKLVLTQPEAGQFKAFSAVCTHAGCAVATVSSGGTINCPCHGSKFHITDGTVAKGPATRPLPETPIVVKGTAITRA
jgi:Rieske Fe-S protein